MLVAPFCVPDVYCNSSTSFKLSTYSGKGETMDIAGIVAQLKQELARLNAAISALEGTSRRGRPPKSSRTEEAGRRGRRRMSAEARAKIAAAQRARWAKQKGKAPAKSTATAQKKIAPRPGMSAAARKKLSALMKARWAARKKSS